MYSFSFSPSPSLGFILSSLTPHSLTLDHTGSLDLAFLSLYRPVSVPVPVAGSGSGPLLSSHLSSHLELVGVGKGKNCPDGGNARRGTTEDWNWGSALLTYLSSPSIRTLPQLFFDPTSPKPTAGVVSSLLTCQRPRLCVIHLRLFSGTR